MQSAVLRHVKALGIELAVKVFYSSRMSAFEELKKFALSNYDIVSFVIFYHYRDNRF